MPHCKVHNVRFYNPELRAIRCMALRDSEKKLVISRSDATLEFWNLSQTWFLERTIVPTTENFSIEGLTWCGDRLFSVGLHGFLVEYDVYKLSTKNQSIVTGGAAYCIAPSNSKAELAIGTEQGYLNLYKINEEGAIFEKFFDKQEGKIICLKFSTNGEFVVSGSIDAIRIWDVQTGHAIHKMTTGRAEVNKPTIVWCLEITHDFTIISGDSRGKLTFWDGKNGSQIESYQSHRADILSICMSEDQNSLYCSGVDPNIINYSKIQIKGGNQKWVKSVQRRIHSHDVNALAICGKKLYSGGADGYLACSFHPPKTLLKMPPILQQPCISLAKESRRVLLRYPKHIEIWSLGKHQDDAGEPSFRGWLQLQEEPKKLVVLYKSKKDEDGDEEKEGIICSAISNDGKWIVYSTYSGVRLFKIVEESKSIKLEKINNLENCDTPCLQAVFSSDSSALVTALHDGRLLLYDLTDENPSIKHKFETDELTDTVTFLVMSNCNKFLVAADVTGNIVVWASKKNVWQHYCKLPKYHCPPTAMSIHPNCHNLVIAYSNLKVVEYDIKKRQLTLFSSNLDDKEVKSRAYPFKNITFDSRVNDIIILHDNNGILVINKELKSRRRKSKSPKLENGNELDRSLETQKFISIKNYKNLIHLDWLVDDEMVAVEVNILSLMEQLPPAFAQKTFGNK